LKWKNDVVDLMLIAIKPEYQSKGVNALLFSDLIPTYVKNGYKWAESNLELEDNASVQLQWQYFDRRLHRRRRAFRKPL
jgi:GNAT superfamily N-acetyltransferase